MNLHGAYDSELQMFVERSREPDGARLLFLRWLAEHGRLEHEAAGPPSGGLAGPLRDGRSSARGRATAPVWGAST